MIGVDTATIQALQLASEIAGEIRLERLLPKMVKALVAYTPMHYCALLEGRENQWQLVCEEFGKIDTNDTPPLAAQEATEATIIGISNTLLNQAARTAQLSISDQTGQAPQSFRLAGSGMACCLPLVKEGKLLALVYLESALSTQLAAAADFLWACMPTMASAMANALDYASLQEKVKERGSEISRQRELVSDAYQNVKLLADIGKDITSKIEIDEIIETVYASVNILMDASVFDIGVYNENEQRIEFYGTIERGEKLPFHYYKLNEPHRLSVLCFLQSAEIVINDFDVEFNHYIPNMKAPAPVAGQRPDALIYLPILSKGEPIGVVTVQSFQKNIYTKYHVDILRNLSVYIGIALENAAAYKEIEEQKELIEQANQGLSRQKEELEQAYQNIKLIGKIGMDITASLDVEDIINTVHQNLQTLMEAPIFWIGIHNEAKNVLFFAGGKEKDTTLPYFELSLAETNRLGVHCFLNNTEVWVNDYPNEYHRYVKEYKAPILGENPMSIIYLPVSVKDKSIGVITVQSFQKGAYTANHVNILRSIAVYAGIALENAFLYENLEQKVSERTAEVVKQKEELEESHTTLEKSYQNVKLLGEIGLNITTELSTDRIIEKVYASVNSLMDASIFAVGLLSESRARIEFRGAMERGEPLPIFYHSMADENRFSVWTVKNRGEVLINDHANEYQKYLPNKLPPTAGADADSIIYLPLVAQNQVIGVLTVQSFAKNAYNKYHVDILRNLALFIANAIENAEAYQKIEAQHEEIRKANEKVTASINYARRIQAAMLPDKAQIKAALPNSFVLFRPRDIVSGDFYWFLEKEDKIFIAAVDCTGHGVPGAFMSMIGNEFLNEIVSLLDIESPEAILMELHKNVRKALKQSDSDNRDGMDVAICVINAERTQLEFAGAKCPLLYIRHNDDGQPQVHCIKGDKMPIGGLQKEEERIFTKHVIALDKPTSFYIFSDGFQDQFGGEHGRKYSIQRLTNFFLTRYELSMEQQRKELRTELVEWIQNEKQIDDIMIVGFKL